MSSFHELRKRLRGDEQEPSFVVRHGLKIVALCLPKDMNPMTSFGSVEVWIGTDPLAVEWARRLAVEKMALPVFTAEHAQGDYQCLGLYYVQPRQPTPDELDIAQKQASRALSGIVFLDRAYVSEIVFR
jgi:hypothetical protein